MFGTLENTNRGTLPSSRYAGDLLLGCGWCAVLFILAATRAKPQVAVIMLAFRAALVSFFVSCRFLSSCEFYLSSGLLRGISWDGEHIKTITFLFCDGRQVAPRVLRG